MAEREDVYFDYELNNPTSVSNVFNVVPHIIWRQQVEKTNTAIETLHIHERAKRDSAGNQCTENSTNSRKSKTSIRLVKAAEYPQEIAI